MIINVKSQRVITRNTSINTPQWMRHALNGEKIAAIKALRETANLQTDSTLSLVHAKSIVEEFMNSMIHEDSYIDQGY